MIEGGTPAVISGDERAVPRPRRRVEQSRARDRHPVFVRD